MASERSLATLLRALQSPANEQDASRLLGSAATLLTLLSNPRNLSLLTHQLLSAPAIWDRPDGLRTCFRLLGVFNSASLQVLHRESQETRADYHFGVESINKEEWVKTVVKGADDRSPRWKHVLVLGGLLVGFEGQGRRGLSIELRKLIEGAVVTATNLALEDSLNQHEMALHTMCLVLSHVFDLLSDGEKSRIDHARLLPVLTQALYFSRDGLQWGYFLGTMDADVTQENNKFNWSQKSTTFFQVQKITSSPLITILGAMSRLMAFSAESVPDIDQYFKLVDNMTTFTRSQCVQWRQNKLSELDPSEEELFMSEQSIKTTLPVLWQLLKNTYFAIVITQSAVFARLIGDGSLPPIQHPFMAIQTLHSLRNLYFISTRMGQNSLSQHTFVYTTAIDILSHYPVQAEAFLREIRGDTTRTIPEHPHNRCMDLFFLNTAEHFASTLPPTINESLLLSVAAPYLCTKSDARLMDLFEAAHSVMLAVFSCPHNHEVTARRLPGYVDTLFGVFPHNLSSRQFHLAVKTLVRVTSPPFAISETQPHFPSTLLEIVRTRASTASRELIPSIAGQPDSLEPKLSEQAAMVVALIDSLAVLPFYGLEEWLPLTAEAMNQIDDTWLLNQCRDRFWEVLSNGEMDVARAESCLMWWNTGKGREMVLNGMSARGRESRAQEANGPWMSGALPPDPPKL